MSEERKAIIPMDEYNELKEFYDRVNAGETATVTTEYSDFNDKVVFKFTPATEALKTAQAVNESLLERINELKKEKRMDANDRKGYLEQLEANDVLERQMYKYRDMYNDEHANSVELSEKLSSIKSMSLLRLIRWYFKKK